MIFLSCLIAVLFVATTMKATPAELTGLPEETQRTVLRGKAVTVYQMALQVKKDTACDSKPGNHSEN